MRLCTGESRYTLGLRSCESPCSLYRKRVEQETYNNCYFDVKLAPECLNAKFII
jgi:hypothetical protein